MVTFPPGLIDFPKRQNALFSIGHQTGKEFVVQMDMKNVNQHLPVTVVSS